MRFVRTRFLVAAAVVVACGGRAGQVGASPLDTLPDPGDTTRAVPRWTVEVTGDVTQPLFDATGIDRRAGQTWAGRVGVVSGPWSFTLGGHQRHLHEKAQIHDVQSWHTTAQVELTGSGQPVRWGLRLGAWGNRADHLQQSTSTSLRVSGLKARLVEMELVRPRDLQWQLDLLGRTALADPRWSVSGAVGLGTSAVTRSVVSGKATISGCTYRLDFGDQRLNAMPLPGCPNALTVSVPNRLLAVDVQQETRYRAVHGHAGAALHWSAGPWRLAAGAELQQWLRQGQDERSVRNLVLASEALHAVTPHLSLVLRGQYMHRQMLGEVPMLYNSRSTSSTRRVLSVMAGVQAQF